MDEKQFPSSSKIPDHLKQEILAGRCIAFVGAGFSAPVIPGWKNLLINLAENLPKDVERSRREDLISLANQATTALQLEGCGQALRDAYGNTETGLEAFEQAVAQAVAPNRAVDDEMARRLKALAAIPFRAILTLNYDNLIEPSGPLGRYDDILREPAYWWERLDWENNWSLQTPLIKLHGDANGDPQNNPIVLGRTDYRRILYENGTYANFMRAALGTYTFLFMGFSFTDAYLNELRSEVLAFLNSHDKKGQRPNPVGYAILEDQAPSVRTFFEQHEGIEVLHYETEKKLDPRSNQLRPVGWVGFTDWLEAIEKETCVAARLRALLGEQAQIVWIDPQHNDNNQRGLTFLRNHVGVNVAELDHPDQLDKTSHQHAVLVISHFGYNSDGPSQLAKALENMQPWGERPPVVVFAGVDFANQNRRLANRLGAIDLATNWTDLMRVIEQVFGRDELNSGPDAATQTGFSRATISPSKQQT